MTSLSSLLKEEPRKVCFTYDLFLNLEGNPPVNHLRCEKLTFNNPTVEFRYKLLMAGGVSGPCSDGRGCGAAAGLRQARCWVLVGLPGPSRPRRRVPETWRGGRPALDPGAPSRGRGVVRCERPVTG